MPVIYMDRASIESLTEKDIREIIDENSTDVKYGMLHDYYVGNHRILGENKKDSTAPNNRLVNNMAKYITDTATGYFVGEPIVYDSTFLITLSSLSFEIMVRINAIGVENPLSVSQIIIPLAAGTLASLILASSSR